MSTLTLLLLAGNSVGYVLIGKPPPALGARRAALLHCEESGGELSNQFEAGELSALRARIQRIQESGLATPSQKLFELATKQSPQQLMQEFVQNSSPAVVQAMQDAVVSLLGQLPPLEFDAQLTTTGDKLAALMLQLQMTGYMLRNAEYVLTIRKVLKLKTRSAAEYRDAFDRLDEDGSGFIDVSEVERLLKQVYGEEGEDLPPYEVAALVNLFDTDGDGRISWDEFSAALGVDEAAADPLSLPLLAGGGGDEASGPSVGPSLSGTVTIELDDGTQVEMDASAYMEQLKLEAQSLRAELDAFEGREAALQKGAGSLSGSISSYVSSLPEAQLKVLTSGISNDVVDAMKQLVIYILRAPSGDGPLGKEESVTIEQAKLQQLCLYQLMLGYRMREAEATGEAQDAIGS